ncbi:MAG TPA: hypothetical protein VGH03_22395 [Caulobacteraceae bacterium]|jgi:hypothetical protein
MTAIGSRGMSRIVDRSIGTISQLQRRGSPAVGSPGERVCALIA